MNQKPHIVTAMNYATPPPRQRGVKRPLKRDLPADDPYEKGGRLEWFARNRRKQARLHDGVLAQIIGDDLAVRSYDEVAQEFYRRTGVCISRGRVYQHLVSAHAKLRKALAGEGSK